MRLARPACLAVGAVLGCLVLSAPAAAATNCGNPGPNQAVLWSEDFALCDVLEIGSYPLSAVSALSTGSSGYFRYAALGGNVWLSYFSPDFQGHYGLGVIYSSDWLYSFSASASVTVSSYAGPRRLNDLSAAERAALLQLIQGFLTEDVLNIHAMHHDWHQYDHMFFSGHRGYLAGMEAYFRAHGGQAFIPVPVWDPSQPIPPEFAWVKPDASGNPREPLEHLDPGIPTPAEFLFPGCVVDDDIFAASVEPFHDGVHGAVGGIMNDIHYSPAAAIFWPWHSYINTLYTNWVVGFWNYCA